jgi:hypothetical protein
MHVIRADEQLELGGFSLTRELERMRTARSSGAEAGSGA